MAQIQESLKNNSIQIVNLGIGQSQGLETILNSLSNIDQCLCSFFKRFQSKQSQYRINIEEYLKRINLCQQKISALQNQKKAITFVSPSKFVQRYKFTTQNKESILKDYKQRLNLPQDFGNLNSLLNTQLEQEECKISEFMIDKNQEAINESYDLRSQLKEKYQKKRGMFDLSNDLNENELKEGIYPKRIKCADTLLVLNTNINPFRKSQQFDNFLRDKKKRKNTKQDLNLINLQDPPIGIRNQLQLYQTSRLIYTPIKKQLTNEIPIPQDLGLDGVAEDFENQTNDQFAMNSFVQKPLVTDPYQNYESQQLINQQKEQISYTYQDNRQQDPQAFLDYHMSAQNISIDNFPLIPIQEAIPIEQINTSQQEQQEQSFNQLIPNEPNIEIFEQKNFESSISQLQLQNINILALPSIETQINNENKHLIGDFYGTPSNFNNLLNRNKQLSHKQQNLLGFLQQIQEHKDKLKETQKKEKGKINNLVDFQKIEENPTDINGIMEIRRLYRQPPSIKSKVPPNRVGIFSDSSDDTDSEYK